MTMTHFIIIIIVINQYDLQHLQSFELLLSTSRHIVNQPISFYAAFCISHPYSDQDTTRT